MSGNNHGGRPKSRTATVLNKIGALCPERSLALMDHTRHKGMFKNPFTSPLFMNSLPLLTSSSHLVSPTRDTMDRPSSNNFSCSLSSSQSLLPSSSPSPLAPSGDTFLYSNSPAPPRDGAVAMHLVNRFNPTVNRNIRSYMGYRPTKQQSQTRRISLAQLTASGPDAMVETSSQHHRREPQYLCPHQDPSTHAYHRASYSGTVAAGGFPVVPPMEWNPLLGDNSLAANPLPIIPRMKERSGEYSAEQAKHFAAPTLASARNQNKSEATTSHRTLAGRRAPPYARPPAEAKTQKTKKRKPREKKQVVEKDDPDALAIAAALRREMQACELGHLECGPCHLRRKGELTVTKKSIEHEIHYMLAYFNPSGSQLRFVAPSIKGIFKDAVGTHLSQTANRGNHLKLRMIRPGHWVLNNGVSQDADPKRLVFTRDNL